MIVSFLIVNILHCSGCDVDVGNVGNLTQDLPDLPPSVSVKLTGLGGNPGIMSLPHDIWTGISWKFNTNQIVVIGSAKSLSVVWLGLRFTHLLSFNICCGSGIRLQKFMWLKMEDISSFGDQWYPCLGILSFSCFIACAQWISQKVIDYKCDHHQKQKVINSTHKHFVSLN